MEDRLRETLILNFADFVQTISFEYVLSSLSILTHTFKKQHGWKTMGINYGLILAHLCALMIS